MLGNVSMPRKRNFILVNGLYLLLVATLITIGNSNAPTIEPVQGDEPIYTITLNTDNAPVALSTTSSGTAIQTTRYVDFDYYYAKRSYVNHVILDIDGKISNNYTTRITSIKSITATFSGGEATLTVGWQSLPTINAQSLTSEITVYVSDNPYFFSITNTGTGELALASLIITYSCVSASYVPGDNIVSGRYPQSQVSDTNLLSILNAAAGPSPFEYFPENWTEYMHYFPNYLDEPCTMWYIDLYHQSELYRGVYFTKYRPFIAAYPGTIDNSFQDDNGYYISEPYWFKYESISWRILDIKNSKALLMSNLLIDSQNYGYIEFSSNHDNNYEQSYIRQWLNSQFLYTAFGYFSGHPISVTNVDNSASSTGYSYNPYACANTNDLVFLLSYAEVTNAAYGFTSSETRQLLSTDYARSQGVALYSQEGASNTLLRSPHPSEEYLARNVTFNGEFANSFVDDTSNDVAPAMWISI